MYSGFVSASKKSEKQAAHDLHGCKQSCCVAHLDGRQISQPPKLHGKAPSAQDLKFIVRILLDVVYLIDWRQKIPQKCDVELVPCKLL